MASLTDQFLEFIRSAYSPQEKVKPHKSGGHTIFFKKAGKPLCYIDITPAGPHVTVVIGSTLQSQVELAPLSPAVKQQFAAAQPYHDGKWLFIQLDSPTALTDLQTLLAIKRPLPSPSGSNL